MGGYVNIKTFDHTTAAGKVKGKEVSVAFKVYSDAHRIAGAHYQTFPSDKPAFADVVEDAATWLTKNEELFKVEPPVS